VSEDIAMRTPSAKLQMAQFPRPLREARATGAIAAFRRSRPKVSL
jgi:hypothetical protein